MRGWVARLWWLTASATLLRNPVPTGHSRIQTVSSGVAYRVTYAPDSRGSSRVTQYAERVGPHLQIQRVLEDRVVLSWLPRARSVSDAGELPSGDSYSAPPTHDKDLELLRTRPERVEIHLFFVRGSVHRDPASPLKDVDRLCAVVLCQVANDRVRVLDGREMRVGVVPPISGGKGIEGRPHARVERFLGVRDPRLGDVLDGFRVGVAHTRFVLRLGPFSFPLKDQVGLVPDLDPNDPLIGVAPHLFKKVIGQRVGKLKGVKEADDGLDPFLLEPLGPLKDGGVPVITLLVPLDPHLFEIRLDPLVPHVPGGMRDARRTVDADDRTALPAALGGHFLLPLFLLGLGLGGDARQFTRFQDHQL